MYYVRLLKVYEREGVYNVLCKSIVSLGKGKRLLCIM